MALPPRGDPRRPLHLAVRSTRMLGVVFLLFGTCALAPMMRTMGRAGMVGYPVFLMLGALVYLGAGGGFLLFSIFLGRRQFWAVVAALVLSSVVSFFWIAGAVALVVAILSGGGGTGTAVPVAFAVSALALVIAALGQLIYHLARSFEAIKYPPFGQEVRGFEPIPVMPAPPVFGPSAAIPPPPPQLPPGSVDSRDTTHGPAPQR